jgi:hypothetical protein
VLVGDRFEAIVDLKTDCAARRLVLQSWHWLGNASKSLRLRIEDELHRFETFQSRRGLPGSLSPYAAAAQSLARRDGTAYLPPT